jgi:methylenetetrahydrofolate--tRNA-(uracil-5-)-methyltransferase
MMGICLRRECILADLVVIGGGLAGCEAAWQAAERGILVELFEMRPGMQTGAHTGGDLAELVCSNSLGSNLPDRAAGVLKAELRKMNSLLMACADRVAVPAGRALAVDRRLFAQLVTQEIEGHANIKIIRQEMRTIPVKPVIVATGPLTSPALSRSIRDVSGEDHLFFYDAIAPILRIDTTDFSIAFRASRYDTDRLGDGDYINCPMTKAEYDRFVDALISADRIELREFEQDVENGVKAGRKEYFESCLPVEILAQRSRQALAYGPLRPVGLIDPRSGQRPYAVVQLRQDNLAGTLYNMVGFQTNLTFSEQKRVFRLIPGLENAEFERYGQMHRNTFIYSPAVLLQTLQHRRRPDLFFAGQITGVEGYVGNIATGLLAGVNATKIISGQEPLELPRTTMLGALCYYITNAAPADFQPMKANFGILPEFSGAEQVRGRRPRSLAFAKRAAQDLELILPLFVK